MSGGKRERGKGKGVALLGLIDGSTLFSDSSSGTAVVCLVFLFSPVRVFVLYSSICSLDMAFCFGCFFFSVLLSDYLLACLLLCVV